MRKKWFQRGETGPHTLSHTKCAHIYLISKQFLLIRRLVWIKSRFLCQHLLYCSLCLPLQERVSILVWQGWLVAVGLRINSPSWWPSSKPLRCTCEASAQRQGGPNSATPTAPKGQRAKRRSEWPMLQVNMQCVCVYTVSADLCCCVEPTPGLFWLLLATWGTHGMGHRWLVGPYEDSLHLYSTRANTYSMYSLTCEHSQAFTNMQYIWN